MTANEEKYLELFDSRMKELFDYSNNELFQGRVIEAMKYSLEAGGKRIRPILTFEFCNICNGNYELAAAPACAVEMIHTYSLIHDDLPSMDNDDMRRGKPSCHIAYGESTAILAGDALNTYAFNTIAEEEALDPETRVRLIAELSASAGFLGMVGGQQMDLEFENSDNISPEELSVMCIAKTGALIKSACKMGAIAAKAPDYLVSKASEYGMYLGLAFQIIDDILDVMGSTEKLGKPVNSDAEENKTTFVTLLGIENAKKSAEYYTEKALAILDIFPDNEYLKDLTEKLLRRDY